MNFSVMNLIQNHIKTKPKPFTFETKFIDIISFIDDSEFSHFPVINDGYYMGSIAADDITTSQTKTVGDYKYALLPYFVRNNADWFEVFEKFAQFNCNILTVLDEQNKYLGYYYYNDVSIFFNNTPFLKDNGLTIVIQKHYLDYSISQIAQIVESNNCKLLGVFISAIKDDVAEITLKASAGNINEIIQTFRRFGYEVISEHNQDIYLNELKDRSAYLDKFLNI